MGDFAGAILTKISDATDPTKQVIVDATGAMKVFGTATVSATSFDIRHLTSADIVTVVATALDIRKLTALDFVSISGSVAVTATALDIRHLAAATDFVTATVSGTVTVSATAFDIRHLTAATDTVTVVATALDTRHLTAATDVVKISDGTNVLAMNSDGSLNVHVTATSGVVDVCAPFVTTTDVVGGGTVEFDYTITSGKKFTGSFAQCSSRGACKIEIGIKNGAFVTKIVYFQQPSDTKHCPLANLSQLGDGTRTVHVRLTNLESSATAMYATIQGSEA